MIYVRQYTIPKVRGVHGTIYYKWKTSYDFLVQFRKDCFPMTFQDYSYLLQCKSNKNRTYFDLLGLAQNHVKDFSLEEFNKSLRQLIIEGTYGSIIYCPHIDNWVFCKGPGKSVILIEDEYYLLPGELSIKDKNKKKSMLVQFIFIDQLGFKYDEEKGYNNYW